MKILYASRTPLAGVCELMARCVNLYTDHEAAVLNKGPGRHRWYCRHETDGREPAPKRDKPFPFARYSILNQDETDHALKWADVIHCMANTSARDMGRSDLIRKKTWVFQWHGAQIWPFERVWLQEDYRRVRWIHIGQGWQRDKWFRPFFDHFGCKVIPNIISIDDILHLPAKIDFESFVVGFAPSNSGRGVNTKGIDGIRSTIPKKWLRLIKGQPFEHCLRMKQTCLLGIDEIATPLYHRSGLEFLSQGTPCICSYDRFTENTLKKVTGSDRMPFVHADENSLRSCVERFRGMKKDELIERSADARKWMESYYHPCHLLRRYFEVYDAPIAGSSTGA